jgi:hypothetical protein
MAMSDRIKVKLGELNAHDIFYFDSHTGYWGEVCAKREFGDEKELFCITSDVDGKPEKKMTRLSREMEVWIE